MEGKDIKRREKEKDVSLAKIYGFGPATNFKLKEAHITVKDDDFNKVVKRSMLFRII